MINIKSIDLIGISDKEGRKINSSATQAHEALETAVALFKDIYRATETWPKPQLFGLIMDTRRAAMGVSMNLTEGQNQDWGGESVEFVKIAQENLTELRQQLLLVQDHTALAETGTEGLLQQVNHLEGALQSLAASLV